MDMFGDVLKQVVLPGLLGAVLIAVFAIARQYAAKIKDERWRKLVLQVVKGLEQMYGPGTGTTKKAEALKALPAATPADIEAAVYDLNCGAN